MSATARIPALDGREAAEADRPPRVLVLWYSQTGQLRRVLEELAAPLADAGYDVIWEELRPEPPFPFPWGLRAFLDVFPETVLGRGCAIAPPSIPPDAEIDLVVLGYQVWFLAPSLPVQALFRSELRQLLAGRPTITVVACRNMWYSAGARLRSLLESAGALPAGHVAVTDDGPTWSTFVTTPRWLLTGRTDRFLRIFPPPGIGTRSLEAVRRLGEVLAARTLAPAGGRPFGGVRTFEVEETVLMADLLAARAFRPWASLAAAVGPPGSRRRDAAMWGFAAWLTAAVPVVMPALAVARLPLRRLVRRVADAHVKSIARPVAAYEEQLAARPGD